MNRFFTASELADAYRLPKHIHDQLLAEVATVEKDEQGEPLFLEAHVDAWLNGRYAVVPTMSNAIIREFARQGRRRVGDRVWTDQEFCQFFEITGEDLQAWIAQGLKVRQCLDGSMRITETAVNDFNRAKVVESPYLTTEEAAKYLRTTANGVYSLLERRKLKKLPGSRTVLFTFDMLDAYLRGDE
jgi:excisionase family DNA binding protein